MPVKQTPTGFQAIADDGTNLGTFPSRASALAAIRRHNAKKKKGGR